MSFGQLNVFAEYIKEHIPNQFIMLEDYAKAKWKIDAGVIEYEINKQSEGYVHVMKMINNHRNCKEHQDIILSEILKYSKHHDTFSDVNWWRIYLELRGKLN